MLSELFIKIGRFSKKIELGASDWYICLKMRIIGQIEAKMALVRPGEIPMRISNNFNMPKRVKCNQNYSFKSGNCLQTVN